MSGEELCAVKELTRAVEGVARELCSLHQAVTSGIVSRTDLAQSEARIVKAIGERVNPKDLAKLSTKLEAATAPLEKAVAENQPG